MFTLATGVAALQPAVAQQPSCADIQWSPAMVSEFPNIADGCQAVVERDGELYAKFNAELVRNFNNGAVKLQIFGREGGSLVRTFNPPKNFTVNIEGRQYRFGELPKGKKLNIYLPDDRFALASVSEVVPVVATPVVIAPMVAEPVEPAPQPQRMAAVLPATASPLPLLGLVGLGLSLLGLGFTSLRRSRKS